MFRPLMYVTVNVLSRLFALFGIGGDRRNEELLLNGSILDIDISLTIILLGQMR